MGHFADIAYQQTHSLVGLQYLNSLVVRRLLEILSIHFDDLIAHLRSFGSISILELASRMR